MVSSAIVQQPEIVYRHSVMVRITHWVNAFCLLVLLVSGLQIFNAHPTLYFGEKSEPDRAVLSMRAVEQPDGSYRGITTIGSTQFDTTGVLGLSRDASGEYENECDRRHPYCPHVYVEDPLYVAHLGLCRGVDECGVDGRRHEYECDCRECFSHFRIRSPTPLRIPLSRIRTQPRTRQ